MKTVLFVARFQPLHKGHMHVMKSLLKKYRLSIVIGSTNKKDKDNPFSYSVRKKMINASLKDYVGKYRIIGINDVHDDKKWTRNIGKKTKYNFVVTGNDWVKRCFKNKKMVKPKMFHSRKYNGTKIRKLIRQGKKWEHLVPNECIKIIRSNSKL